MRAPARYGGVLVVALAGGEPASIDPTLNVRTATEIYKAMCLPLYIRNNRLQRLPLLAAAPPVLSKDKLSYAVQLRKGIEFITLIKSPSLIRAAPSGMQCTWSARDGKLPESRRDGRPPVLPRSVTDRIRLEYSRGRGIAGIARGLAADAVRTVGE